jgi:hypothetical protein
LFGFAAPVIIGHWLTAQAVLSSHGWVGPVVILSEKPTATAVVVLTAVWLLGSSFARGMITWVVMCCEGRRSARGIHMTLARYPALLAGSVAYGAFALACIMCMNLLMPGAQPDASAGKVLPIWSGPSHAWSGATQQLAGRSASLFIPNPGWPFVEPLFRLISPLSLQAKQVTEYEQWLTETHGSDSLNQPVQSGRSVEGVSTAAGLALLVLAEPLLRFYTVMAFKPSRSQQVPELPGGVGPRRFAALTALFDSVRFGLRHFGVVVVHIWLSRCALIALMLGLVEFPLAIATHFMMPNLVALMGKSQHLPLLNFAQVSAAALVSAIALAFGAVYDARLHAALSGYDRMTDSAIARSSKSATPISGAHLRM